MKSMTSLSSLRSAAFGALTVLTLGQPALRAADHGDAPNLAHDQAADLADAYFFLDPADNSKAVMIMTVRGFIVPGEASNFGIFDPNVTYRFNIENTGDTKIDKFIDVKFSPRAAVDGPTGVEILQVPQPQSASIKVSSLKKAVTTESVMNGAILTTNPSLEASAPAQVISQVALGADNIDFFAGEVDDPFFFDIPAFSAFVKSVRAGSPDASVFNRGRDSFAGYNVMCIAMRVPVTFLRATKEPISTKIGLYVETKRKIVLNPNSKTGEIKSTGALKTIDRLGVPAVNVVLIPFNRKNEYNFGTPTNDKALRFGGDILKTLDALGTTGADVFPPTNNALTLAQVAVLNGDLLRLETDGMVTSNSGNGGGDNAGAGFPNGRRLKDDVVDILLTLVANGNPFTGMGLLKDNVDANDVPLQNTFPYVAKSQQPLPRGGMLPAPDTNVDDNTRN